MKNLKLYLSVMLLLIIVSCKKKDEVTPEETKMDLTKYFITMEFPTQFTGGRTYNIPYLIVFDNDEKATHYGFASPGPEITPYKLEEDKITLIVANQTWIFTISDNQITAFSGIPNPPKSVKLHEVPATNQLVGKYSGMLQSRLVNTAFPYRYVLNQTQFGEEMVDNPTLDYVINPVKNVFAVSYIDSVKRYFLAIDGKLIVVRMKNGGTNAESYMYGTLTSDEL